MHFINFVKYDFNLFSPCSHKKNMLSISRHHKYGLYSDSFIIHSYIYIYIYIHIYIYIYIYIYKNMQLWKQCALPATTVSIWQIKAIYVTTGRTHCFHNCIHTMPLLLLWDFSNVCRGSLTTAYVIYTYIDRCGSK